MNNTQYYELLVRVRELEAAVRAILDGLDAEVAHITDGTSVLIEKEAT